MPQPPPIVPKPFNQELLGFYGEFGTGSNAQIFFLQTGLQPSQLKMVDLISDIPGSEKWAVRDLFQREVDEQRVERKLLPYFQDAEKVKFFNPITLTLLPTDPQTHSILADMPLLKPERISLDGHEWDSVEHKGYFRFRHIPDAPGYGHVEWNDSRVRVVAIDGQHRLSALKRFFSDPTAASSGTFQGWTIPVVIFGLRALSPEHHTRTVLDVVRSIFIYINKEAKPPNTARQILLSDESINSISAQELLQHSHENDLRDTPDPSRVPLLFYDWRGLEEDGQRQTTPGAKKTVEEIHDWLTYYVLGEDFSAEQQTALEVQPVDPLHPAFLRGRLTPELADRAREVFRTRVLPGLAHMMQNFKPYRDYIDELRTIEAEFCSQSDTARHAFYDLRFGSNRAGESQQKSIRKLRDEIIERISDIDTVPDLLEHDIGMRGVMYAFGAGRLAYNKARQTTVPWLEYSQWFTTLLNAAHRDKWFDPKGVKAELRRHVTEDHNETIVNYRLDAAEEAFGAMVLAVALAYGMSAASSAERTPLGESRGAVIDTLWNTLLKGYKKEMKVLLKEKYPDGGEAFKKAVTEAATEKTEKHIQKFTSHLDQAKL